MRYFFFFIFYSIFIGCIAQDVANYQILGTPIYSTSTGKIGIGTNTPSEKLEINGGFKAQKYIGSAEGLTFSKLPDWTNAVRNYSLNQSISGTISSNSGDVYLLLFEIYKGASLMTDQTSELGGHHVQGKISAIGNASSRIWSVEINASTSNGDCKTSLINYTEKCRFVSLFTNSKKYLAIEISNGGGLSSFSFTGYSSNANLSIVTTDQVSDVNYFAANDPVYISASQFSVEQLRASQINLSSSVWPDYVFAPGYKLLSLNELETYIQTHGHLPNIPSANEVEKNGIKLAEMQVEMMRKIEELNLYMIQLKKADDKLQQKIDSLKSKF